MRAAGRVSRDQPPLSLPVTSSVTQGPFLVQYNPSACCGPSCHGSLLHYREYSRRLVSLLLLVGGGLLWPHMGITWLGTTASARASRRALRCLDGLCLHPALL